MSGGVGVCVCMCERARAHTCAHICKRQCITNDLMNEPEVRVESVCVYMKD